MKRSIGEFLALVLAFACLLLLSSCDENDINENDINDTINGIIADNPDINDTINGIIADNPDITLPAMPGGDPTDQQASEGLEFSLNEDGESYSVVGIGTCTDANLVIPNEYNGKPVTGIGSSPFEKGDFIISITIPDSIKTIDSYFDECNSLMNITVDKNNEHYKSIDGCLYTNDGKTLVHYPPARPGDEFVVPDGVTNIGDYAFFGSLFLNNIILADSVTSIGYCAFLNHITSISVYETNEHYRSIEGNLYTNDGKTLVKYAPGKTDSSFTIPEGVTNIGDYAFEHCALLKSVVIGDSVTSIGDYAFANCHFSEVKLPDSVTSIGKSAFEYCGLLESVNIGNGIISIGDHAFANCSLLKLELPDSVISIGDSAFEYCIFLTSVTVGDGVKSIGKFAFNHCESLKSVIFGNRATLPSLHPQNNYCTL